MSRDPLTGRPQWRRSGAWGRVPCSTPEDALCSLALLLREHDDRGKPHGDLERAAVDAVGVYATTRSYADQQTADAALDAYRQAIHGFGGPDRTATMPSAMDLAAELDAMLAARGEPRRRRRRRSA
jgi:hypothetical protein